MTSPHIEHAQRAASVWYEQQITQPRPINSILIPWEDAIAHIIGAHEPNAQVNSFSFLLTRAWLDGVIPHRFTEKAREYFEEMMRRRKLYLAAVEEHGAVAVHERRVQWLNQ